MQENHSFEYLGRCEQVDLILKGAFGFESYVLWRAKAHADRCASCQRRNPNAVAFLSDQIRRLETALTFEIEEIRGDHIREAGAIGREAILSRPDAEAFPLDDSLLYNPHQYDEKSGAKTALQLVTSLAKAGSRVKQVFAAIHGKGLVWFNVVVNLNDCEEEHAWKECAGLIRRLSDESREFVFSAALAAELFPDLALLAFNPEYPDAKEPSGVHLGVLYKAIQTAASGYVGSYLSQNLPDPLPSAGADDLETARTISPTRNAGETVEEQIEPSDEVIENLLQGQTAMMGSLAEIEKAARKLLEAAHRSSNEIKHSCEATSRHRVGKA